MSKGSRESQLTPNTALDFAEQQFKETKKWPRSRFRVDCSMIGSSHLMSVKKANWTRIQYGGQVIELIPAKRNYLDSCKSLGRKPKDFVK